MSKPRLATKDGKPVDSEQPKEGSPEWYASMRDAGYGGWGMMASPEADYPVVPINRQADVDK